MRTLVVCALVLSAFASACGKAAPPSTASAPAAMTVKEAVANHAKYEGQKIAVRGIYTQGYSNGGRPTDAWALVIKDARKDEHSVDCLVPATQDRTALEKGNDPRVTVEGTARFETTGRGGLYLHGCTFKID